MMRVRVYPVLLRAVEEGVARGYARAHKHTESPSDEAIRDAIVESVLGEIAEWFSYDDDVVDEPCA